MNGTDAWAFLAALLAAAAWVLSLLLARIIGREEGANAVKQQFRNEQDRHR